MSIVYISYDYYRVFYYVAKCGSVSQAAKQLFNNQPNLTRSIRNLESELGCTLFLRSNRGMKLTPEGEKLYNHVRIAFTHIETGEAEIAESRNLQAGSVYVAASEVALRCLLLPVLKKYRMQYPGVHLRISNHSTPQAIAALKDGTADIAVVTTPTIRTASLSEIEIKSIREVAVCSPLYSGLVGRQVALSELAEHPLISLGESTMSYAFYESWFADHRLPYCPDIEAFTADQVLPMVEAGLGIGFVPKEFIYENANVCIIALKEEIPERSMVLIKRKDQPLSVAAKELERMLRVSAPEDAVE